MQFELSRRAFVALLGLTAASPSARAAASASAAPLLLSAYGAGDPQQFGVAAPQAGSMRARSTLPGRAHAVVAHPNRDQAVVIARRPGDFAARLALPTLDIVQPFYAAAGRHFYGHGAFDAAGARLFTTENDYDGERGVIGVRDANAGYRQIAEWSSGNIGPHQLVLAADGATVVVANGGILTHPDSGRSKLNIPSMHSSLTRLDAASGELLASVALADDYRYLSLRHLAVSANNDVVFGAQNEGSPSVGLPLVGAWRANGELSLFEIAPALRQGYIGSVAVDPGGRFAAASAPRDGLVVFYALDSGRLLGSFELNDGCGLAAGDRNGEFWLSSGQGDLCAVQASDAGITAIARARLPVQWDNHLSRV